MELNLIVDNKNLKQRISIKSKGKLWIQANVDAAIERVKFDYNDPNSNDRACDDLINGRLHKRDYAFLTNPYGDAGRTFPIDIENWPIVKGSYNLLKGEESKRKLPFRVIQVGENAIQESILNEEISIHHISGKCNPADIHRRTQGCISFLHPS